MSALAEGADDGDDHGTYRHSTGYIGIYRWHSDFDDVLLNHEITILFSKLDPQHLVS
jgi:hypothetical protein